MSHLYPPPINGHSYQLDSAHVVRSMPRFYRKNPRTNPHVSAGSMIAVMLLLSIPRESRVWNQRVRMIRFWRSVVHALRCHVRSLQTKNEQ